MNCITRKYIIVITHIKTNYFTIKQIVESENLETPRNDLHHDRFWPYQSNTIKHAICSLIKCLCQVECLNVSLCAYQTHTLGYEFICLPVWILLFFHWFKWLYNLVTMDLENPALHQAPCLRSSWIVRPSLAALQHVVTHLPVHSGLCVVRL